MKKIDLSALQPYFVKKIHDLIIEKGTTQQELARLVDMPGSNLSNLLTLKSQGKYIRPLTAHYLLKFFHRGLLKVADFQEAWERLAPRLAANPKNQRINRRIKEFWNLAKTLEDLELQQLASRCNDKGFDVKAILRALLEQFDNRNLGHKAI